VKILRAAVADQARGEPGEVVSLAEGVAVACTQGALRLLEIQPAGKRAMPAAAFARGARNFIGSRLE
jgi:methionyl-tRNA formyltransferase